MKLSACLLALAACLSAAVAMAQEPFTAQHDPNSYFSMGQMTPTPEMWFYEQARRDYLDPWVAVRSKAEFEASQRQRRLAAMRWFGMSNSRPSANPTPVHGYYSPTWTSNSRNPYHWQGTSGGVIMTHRSATTTATW